MIKLTDIYNSNNIDAITADDTSKHNFTKQQKELIVKLAGIDKNNRYTEATFALIPVNSKFAAGWNAYDLARDDGTEDFWLLYDKKTKSVVTLDDIAAIADSRMDSDDLAKAIKKKGWVFKSYEAEKSKHKLKKYLKQLNLQAADAVSLKIDKRKKLTTKEEQLFVDACHKLVDAVYKDQGISALDTYGYNKLKDALGI